jgi:sulfatase modifying factor 1
MHIRSFSGRTSVAATIAFGGWATSVASGQITVPTVPIGNAGNAPDPTTLGERFPAGFGSVAYAYSIGTTEVTNAQYAAFLNAVATTDTHALYNSGMAGFFGGITRSGSPGSYIYTVIHGRENYPVNFVSFWDAVRFANWMHNGQPTGEQNSNTTEDGAYTLTADGINSNTIIRNAGWKWALTNENEWYKAAYHQPADLGGDVDSYWLYPTASNTITTEQANYGHTIGTTTPAGTFGTNFYGTSDMGGNLWEWNEAFMSRDSRGIRGGSFYTYDDSSLRADWRENASLLNESINCGFRVAHVPERLCDISIVTQPMSPPVIPGETASFSLLASGRALSYQWRRSGVAIAEGGRVTGVTTPNLLISSVTTADQGQYDCIVTGTCGTVASRPAVLSCKAFITSQPQGGTFVGGQQLSLEIEATGTAGASFRWRKDGVNLFNGLVYRGVTSHSLIINAYEPTQSGEYSVAITNSCGVTISEAALLEISCPSDFNHDGGIDGQDAIDFFDSWEDGLFVADLNFDGGIDGSDVTAFFVRWEAGC